MKHLILLCFLTAFPNFANSQTNAQQNAKTADQEKQGTEQNPVSIKLVSTPESDAKAKDDEKYRAEKAHEDWLLTRATIILAIFTALLWFATFRLARHAKKSGEIQAAKMSDSVAEAVRAANAMESVATATKNNAILMQGIMQKQMRAYISVDTGSGTYQDENNNFAGGPILVNTGFTPARNVCYRVDADIFSIDGIPPEKLKFHDLAETKINDAVLGPRQQVVIQGVVKNRFSDPEVIEIMKGDKKRLYVWGVVTYNDIFGDHWETKFCHNHIFYFGHDKNIKVSSYYHAAHNSAT